MSEERTGRRFGDQAEGAYCLAILYTVGFLGMLAALMLLEIPANNRELLLTLLGIMSAAQLGIIKHYYDGSQAASKAAAESTVRAARNEGVLQELARAAPALAATVPGTPIAAETVNIDANKATLTAKDAPGT